MIQIVMTKLMILESPTVKMLDFSQFTSFKIRTIVATVDDMHIIY